MHKLHLTKAPCLRLCKCIMQTKLQNKLYRNKNFFIYRKKSNFLLPFSTKHTNFNKKKAPKSMSLLKIFKHSSDVNKYTK